MAHSIKIEDKLYEKLRAYCDINGISVTKLCNDAILDYLNTIKFGDAPFLKPNTVDSKGNVYTEEVVEKLKEEANSKYRDENGHLIVTQMPSEDAEKMITKILSENQDPGVTKEQLEDVKETFRQGVDMIATVDTATDSDYTAVVDGTIDKDGNFEITKTSVVKRPSKRRL